MRFELTDDQQAIQRTAKEFLASRYPAEEVRRLALEDERGFTDEQWRAIAELGWPALVVAEDDGGLGLGVVELAVLQEQLGYALAPTPLLSTRRGRARDRRRRAATSSAQSGCPGSPRASGAGRSRRCAAALDGRRRRRADRARSRPCPMRRAPTCSSSRRATSGSRWSTARRGVTVEPVDGLDPTRRLSTVTLDGAPSTALAGADGAALARARDVDRGRGRGRVGRGRAAGDGDGGRARRERKQFGRPIGVFQAVSHPCAQMLLEVEGARSAVLFAAWALDDSPEEAPLAAAMAKAYASDAGWRVPAAALQVLGGIGFTWEHDLHFWLKRGRANAAAGGRRALAPRAGGGSDRALSRARSSGDARRAGPSPTPARWRR